MFYNVDGVIVIWGVDFVNMFWLRLGSLVFMVNFMGKGFFYIYNYCCILKLFLVEWFIEIDFLSFFDF